MNGGRYLWIIKEWQVRRNYSAIYILDFFLLLLTKWVGE